MLLMLLYIGRAWAPEAASAKATATATRVVVESVDTIAIDQGKDNKAESTSVY